MIYSTELANKIETTDVLKSKYLEAGIHENVQLVGAKVDKSINENIFLEVKFTKEGQDLTHTEWESTKKPGESDEECQTRGSKQVKRIMQILECFYPKEALVFAGSSYKDFVDWVAMMLNAANKSILLRVKIVYNKKGYTTLPNYCKFTFIEPMNLPEGEKSKIAELSIDQFTKPVIADVETKDTNPLMETSSDPTGDLPF